MAAGGWLFYSQFGRKPNEQELRVWAAYAGQAKYNLRNTDNLYSLPYRAANTNKRKGDTIPEQEYTFFSEVDSALWRERRKPLYEDVSAIEDMLRRC